MRQSLVKQKVSRFPEKSVQIAGVLAFYGAIANLKNVYDAFDTALAARRSNQLQANVKRLIDEAEDVREDLDIRRL